MASGLRSTPRPIGKVIRIEKCAEAGICSAGSIRAGALTEHASNRWALVMNVKWPGRKIWRQYSIYGELLCFLLAWVVGLAVVFVGPGRDDSSPRSNVAASNDYQDAISY